MSCWGWLTLPPLILCCTVAAGADDDEDVDYVVLVVVDVVDEDEISSCSFSARNGRIPSFLSFALITRHWRAMFRR